MLREKICPICGRKFLGRPNKIYCCPECRAKSQSKSYKEAKANREQK